MSREWVSIDRLRLDKFYMVRGRRRGKRMEERGELRKVMRGGEEEEWTETAGKYMYSKG